MAAYTFDFSSRHFWDPLAERLCSEGADLRGRYPADWMDRFEDLFSKWDLASARLALQPRPATDRACVIEFGESAEVLVEADYQCYADSMTDALAYLLLRATGEKCFPDGAWVDQASGTVRFDINGKLWCHITPWRGKSVDEALASRGASTLLGLRNAASPGDELLRRLQRWPGMDALHADTSDGMQPLRDVDRTHVPAPKEWRASAVQLLEALSIDATEKHIQALTCAVFEAPSWNHLTGRLRAYRAAGMQPCAVIVDETGQSAGKIVALANDLMESVPAFLRAASERASTWGGMQLSFDRAFGGAPYYRIGAPVGRTVQKWAEPHVSLTMLDRVRDYDGKFRLVVDAVLSSDGGGVTRDALLELFMVGRTGTDRNSASDSINKILLIAQENGWRFLEDWTGTAEACLVVERVDESGNRKGRAVYVPYRKAEIHLVEASGLYVVTGEYNGHLPVAVARVSESTAAKVARKLAEMRSGSVRPWSERRWSQRDRATYEELAANARP